jgi:hypothetical protein
MRGHRRAVQKLLYADVLRCMKCGYRLNRLHQVLHLNLAFLFSRDTRCIKCGTTNVRRMTKRDRIDTVSRNLASQLLHLSGAPLNKCVACRLQYYDWRPPQPASQSE